VIRCRALPALLLAFAIVLALLALEFAAAAFALGGFALVLLWPAFALFTVAVAYAIDRPSLFGRDGPTFRLCPRLILAPYLAFAAALWHILRLIERQPPWGYLTEDILIGRRLLAHEYPHSIASIVDLTCEFSEQLPTHGSVSYLNVPLLDGGRPRPEMFPEVVRRVLALPRPLYIHCARGHGRTGTIAAAILLAQRRAGSVGEALDTLAAIRPGLRISRLQRRAVEALVASSLAQF
jgi:hypothetical protein